MSEKFMTKKKTLTSVVACLVAAVILLGGTFAWQSISQQALNEIKSTVNPGGRLHDDFVEVTAVENTAVMTYDKDVYVENFTSRANNGVQVFARVRLDEYMEIGKNAGSETESTADSLIPGANLNDKTSWTTYKFGEDSDFRDYFEMSFAGSTVYMPTFNKDMNSLEADINGTFKNNFEDYYEYTDGEEKVANATYAAVDEDGNITTKTVEESHIATSTLNSFIIPMDEYVAAVEAGELDGNPFDGTGDFWVYDNDGWAYWANPIDPDTATGLLLNEINRTEEIINDDWYYAINVVAQFITYDDMGAENGTGFYDETAGTAPTAEALNLLNRIGVKVNFQVNTAAELKTALANGGVVTLTDDIEIDSQITVNDNTVLNLDDYEIKASEELYDEDIKSWSLISVRNGATLTVNGGVFTAIENDSFCVDVRDGSKVIINGGVFTGNVSAVYVLEGEAVIYGGNFSILQKSEQGDYRFLLNCYDANFEAGTAKITVCGGTYNGFNPEDYGEVSVPAKYEVAGTDGVYTVTKK